MNDPGVALGVLLFVALLVGGFIWFLSWASQSLTKRIFCLACGSTAETRRVMPGSLLVEVVAWCCFLLPGLIYSLWRHSAAFSGCGKCHSRSIVPLDSPVAQAAYTREISQRISAPSPSFRP